jgi:hypothetical protein
MRGSDEQTGSLFSYVSCEARVPPGHPLRLIRAVVDEALDVLSPEFDQPYARVGRPGIAPEKLLRALLLQAALLDPLGMATDGATGLQPTVPLVCRPGEWMRRSGMPARSARIATGSLDMPDDLRNWPEPPRRQREFAKLVRSLQQ